MEQGTAPASPDPRQVITPLHANLVEDLLADLGLLGRWQSVVDGLREGFHVGADSLIPETKMFKNHASSELVGSPYLVHDPYLTCTL